MSDNTASRSQWFVWGLTAVALLLGWALRTATLTRTRPVEEAGVRIDVPAQWVVEPASGGLSGQPSPDLVLTSYDPLSPGTHYAIRVLPAQPDSSLAALASFQNLQRAQSETAFRVLDQTPVVLDEREGYRVRFAYVDASEMSEAPVVYEGVDYYFPENGAVLVVTLETHHDFDAAFTVFKDFAAAAQYGDAP